MQRFAHHLAAIALAGLAHAIPPLAIAPILRVLWRIFVALLAVRLVCVLVFGATLAGAIRHIVLLISKKQMIRIDASRNIAAVKDSNSTGNRSTVNFPRHAMNQVWVLVYRKLAIALRLRVPEPEPTLIRFFDIPPKPFGDWRSIVMAMNVFHLNASDTPNGTVGFGGRIRFLSAATCT